jgi:hypothetical protein
LIQKLDNLASITVKLPKENIVVPGIYYFIFQRLAWEGIIINEVISTSNEFTILVSEEQVDVAFKVIKERKESSALSLRKRGSCFKVGDVNYIVYSR